MASSWLRLAFENRHRHIQSGGQPQSDSQPVSLDEPPSQAVPPHHWPKLPPCHPGCPETGASPAIEKLLQDLNVRNQYRSHPAGNQSLKTSTIRSGVDRWRM
ncbi:hypothetical protein AC579_7595 [Pseudocercospora musae]|uniref:Uncharacterized protein n=1 Tax=Pseudocercospora musae TaxID=113226 RepID=A0A139H3R0_9PEZI|nr:hypothetical protein AC579_7595 [Pseudocercospora musae]